MALQNVAPSTDENERELEALIDALESEETKLTASQIEQARDLVASAANTPVSAVVPEPVAVVSAPSTAASAPLATPEAPKKLSALDIAREKARKERAAEASTAPFEPTQQATHVAKPTLDQLLSKSAVTFTEEELLEAEGMPKPAAAPSREQVQARIAAVKNRPEPPAIPPSVPEEKEEERAFGGGVLTHEPPPSQGVPFEAPAELVPEAAGITTSGLRTFIDPQVFRADTRIGHDNLDDCFYKQADQVAFYGVQSTKAAAQFEQAKLQVEITEASLSAAIRKQLIADAQKPTEKAIDEAMKLSPQWQDAQRKLIEAKQIAGINKACYDSMEDRRFMLIGLGAKDRDQAAGQLRLMAASQSQTALQDNARSIAARSNGH